MKRLSSAAPDLLMRAEALQAFREAVAKVIAEHKRLGMRLSILRDGAVVHISAEEAEADYAAHAARTLTQ
jgi:hypothetical protein